jgi:hypothetical protein
MNQVSQNKNVKASKAKKMLQLVAFIKMLLLQIIQKGYPKKI